MKNLLRFLLRNAPGLALLTGLAALLSGACAAGVIALVNAALGHPGAATAAIIWSFAALGLGKLATNFGSQVLLARFSQTALSNLRRELIEKILAVPLRHLEKIGASRLMVALTDDVLTITSALLCVPAFVVNLAILLGGGVYLAWLSWKVLLGFVAFIVLGAIGHRLFVARGFQHLNDAREAEDRLFKHFRALTEGIKELKLHRERRAQFVHKEVSAAMAKFQRHNVGAEIHFNIAQSWGHLLFFTLLGLILFALPVWQPVSSTVLTGYVVTTLYLMGPLAGLLGSLSPFSRASVSLRKIDELGLSLASHVSEDCPLSQKENGIVFGELELRDVTHSYHNEKDDSHFLLGPLSLTFDPGEVVFLVGGNGSGKSTLGKIITGLYPPEKGEIRLNGRPITDENRDNYRQLFSSVFSDFYLFENLLGLRAEGLDERARGFLTQLHLEHKVKVRAGQLSTIDLSQGQRKRLALLTAYLEDRPFYFFDEWASDQDPQFKDLFYRELVPELRARGKTVVVITHDDRYFPLADRVIKLDYGQLMYERRPAAGRVESGLQVLQT
jgi:putative ATP-binding cassette transporter